MFEIDFPWGSRIHCPRCALSEEEFEKFNDGKNVPFQNFLLKNLNEGYVQFCQTIPPPSGMGGFTIYDLSAGLEDEDD